MIRCPPQIHLGCCDKNISDAGDDCCDIRAPHAIGRDYPRNRKAVANAARRPIDAVTDATDEGGIILHKGIAERNFRRQFTLMDNIEVTGANFVNGILSVYLVNVVPEKEQRRKVVIGSGDARGVFNKAKELLTE